MNRAFISRWSQEDGECVTFLWDTLYSDCNFVGVESEYGCSGTSRLLKINELRPATTVMTAAEESNRLIA